MTKNPSISSYSLVALRASRHLLSSHVNNDNNGNNSNNNCIRRPIACLVDEAQQQNLIIQSTTSNILKQAIQICNEIDEQIIFHSTRSNNEKLNVL